MHQKKPSTLTAYQAQKEDACRSSSKIVEYISYWGVAVFIIALLIFTEIIQLGIKSDIQVHINYIEDIINRISTPPANILYYLILYTVALFNTGFQPLSISTVIVLSSAVTAKFILARRFAIYYFKEIAEGNSRITPSDRTISLLALFSIFAFSLPTSRILEGVYYLGQIPPNVWHNSTTIFLMPFAFLLFWISYQQLLKPTPLRIFTLTLLCIVNILAKPSFYFVFCVVYPLMLLRSFGLKKDFWLNLIPLVMGSFLLIIQYYLIYKLGFSNMDAEKSGIGFGPFMVWSHFSSNIAISFLASIIFPFAFVCIYWKDFLKNLLLQYTVLAFLFAVVIFCVLIESGPRLYDGNFFWQCVVCNYFLFLVVSLQFYEKIRSIGMTTWYNIIILICYAIQVESGFAYLAKLFITHRWS
jgi:hypothetical protein